MNKLLNIFKYLFIVVIMILNFLLYRKGISLTWYGHLLYLILIGIFLILTIKDSIKKDSISSNKLYNILTILVFLIMGVILFKVLYDPHFAYNDSLFMKEYSEYNVELYGEAYYPMDRELIFLFIRQNINYFLVMLSLLLVYRFINKDKKKRIR